MTPAFGAPNMNATMSRLMKRHPARQLFDDFLDSYVSWRQACEDVHAAYEGWRSCKPMQRKLAFMWYTAALDREEDAARVHSQRAQRLRATTG
jgi:hypothetical protein